MSDDLDDYVAERDKREPGFAKLVERARFLSTGQVARKLGLDPRTIRRRCEDGTIPAHRLEEGDWRVSGEWVDQQIRQMGVVRRRTPDIPDTPDI